MHNKFGKDPLLYIHQGKKHAPKPYMQNEYVTPKKHPERNDQPKIETPANTKKPRGRRRNPSFQQTSSYEESVEDTQTFTADSEGKEDTSEQIQSSPRDKKFKDMTLEEKVNHFANTSAISPSLRCKVQMSNRSLRGKIIDFADNIVYMQIGRRTHPTEIPFDQIIDIQLLGF